MIRADFDWLTEDFCLGAILGSVKRVLLPASLAFAVVATRL